MDVPMKHTPNQVGDVLGLAEASSYFLQNVFEDTIPVIEIRTGIDRSRKISTANTSTSGQSSFINCHGAVEGERANKRAGIVAM